ncbi:MAG: alpha/beta hydrolase [Sphingobacteriales bacterium]|nr:MAG: alpha/beta hydrolase [Sphingobacteriales bacterium]
MDTREKFNLNIVGNTTADKTILFAHGFGTNQTSFQPIVEAFKDDYRIVLFDYIGSGQSDINAYEASKYSNIYGYVNDLIEVCKSVALKDAILVGQSISGMIGFLACIQYPEFFSKLIMIGSSPRYLNDESRRYVGGFDMPDLEGLYAAMESDFKGWALGFAKVVMGNTDRPYLAEQFAETLGSMRNDIGIQLAKTIFQSDNRHELDKVDKPVLIVQTVNDVAVPESVGRYMDNNIPNSELVKVQTEGHFPHISAPNEIIKVIKDFI